jgi:hypothetical protein
VGLWWVPIVLVTWFGVAIVAALCIGPVLRRGSEARNALDRQLVGMGEYEPSRDEPRAPAASRGGQPTGHLPPSCPLGHAGPATSDGADSTLKRNSTA